MANLINNNIAVIVIAMAALLIIFLAVLVLLYVRLSSLKSKYDYFMGAERKDKLGVPFELLLSQYVDEVRKIGVEHTNLKNTLSQQKVQLDQCIQKVAIVRYNPFDGMGGDQCFAVALLDNDDNGVVINGIHASSGSYTYSKPIEKGASSYNLSSEEIQAIDLARNKKTASPLS